MNPDGAVNPPKKTLRFMQTEKIYFRFILWYDYKNYIHSTL